MNEEFVASVISAFTHRYDEPPALIRRFSRTRPFACESAVMVYLPDEAARTIPEHYVTEFATAGYGAADICADFPCEFSVAVRGPLDEPATAAMAQAIVHLAEAPLLNGRPFHDGQVLSNVSLPQFPRVDAAMIVDWDSVYGFRFGEPIEGVGLLRVVPLFPGEAEFVESQADRHRAYRALRIRGMDEADPHRNAVV